MIDVSFDFRTDAGGKDPDDASPTLRRYHRILWSRPLPSGKSFGLSDCERGVYLHHRSQLGEFWLASDTMMPTFSRWTILEPIMRQLAEEEHEAFLGTVYTIGGMIVFPGNRIDRMMTINGARGFNRSIADRFDLTLECIRRHYLLESSPLGATLARYSDFFALFGDFRGYVEYFLLDDLVHADGTIDFILPFDGFRSGAVPTDFVSYVEFRRRSIDFIEARNARIASLGL